MPEPDVRDERLGDLLDRAVAGVEPEDRSARVVRSGRRRQAVQAVAAITTAAVFVAAVAWVGSIAEDDATIGARHGSLASEGWTLESPGSWTATAIEPCEMSDGPRTGVIVSSVPFTFRDPDGGTPSCEERFVFDGFPADGVAISYEPTGVRWGVQVLPMLDTVLPLEPGDMTTTDAIRGGPAMSYRSIVVDGDLKAFARLWVGPDATEADVEAVRAALGSLDVAGAARWTTSHVDGREWAPDVDLLHPDDWRVAAIGGLVDDADLQPLLTLASPGVGERPCRDGSLDPRAGVAVDVGWWSGGGWGGGPEPSFPEREGAIAWNDGETSRVTCPIGQAERSTFRFTDGGLRYVVDVTSTARLASAPEAQTLIMEIVNGVSFSAVLEREPAVRFESSEAPWSFSFPVTWDTRTYEQGGPELKTNSLITTVANGQIPAEDAFRPNSDDPDATEVFGGGGAVVSIERFWTHETSGTGAGEFGPGTFADDAQNPGWTFRERARCEGTLCWHVLEWVGPNVSEKDRAAAEAIADSVGLADVARWTETDGVSTTLHDEEHGFTVTFPNEAWRVADENLVPALVDPVEILSLGTFDMPVEGPGLRVIDAPVAPAALAAMGAADAFVTIQEDDSAFIGDRYRRPGAFEVGTEPEILAGNPPFEAYWIPFSDAGRGLYLFVAIGHDASPKTVDEAWAVADSLRFLAAPPA